MNTFRFNYYINIKINIDLRFFKNNIRVSEFLSTLKILNKLDISCVSHRWVITGRLGPLP